MGLPSQPSYLPLKFKASTSPPLPSFFPTVNCRTNNFCLKTPITFHIASPFPPPFLFFSHPNMTHARARLLPPVFYTIPYSLLSDKNRKYLTHHESPMVILYIIYAQDRQSWLTSNMTGFQFSAFWVVSFTYTLWPHLGERATRNFYLFRLEANRLERCW